MVAAGDAAARGSRCPRSTGCGNWRGADIDCGTTGRAARIDDDGFCVVLVDGNGRGLRAAMATVPAAIMICQRRPLLLEVAWHCSTEPTAHFSRSLRRYAICMVMAIENNFPSSSPQRAYGRGPEVVCRLPGRTAQAVAIESTMLGLCRADTVSASFSGATIPPTSFRLSRARAGKPSFHANENACLKSSRKPLCPIFSARNR